MRPSIITRPLAIAASALLFASPLACGDDEEPEVLHEPGVTYESDLGIYSFELEAASWPPSVDTFPLTIALFHGPDPLPEDPPTVSVECQPPSRWPELDITAKPPKVTPTEGNRFDLDYEITTPGIWMQEMTVTDAEGNEDTCVMFLRIRDRP